MFLIAITPSRIFINIGVTPTGEFVRNDRFVTVVVDSRFHHLVRSPGSWAVVAASSGKRPSSTDTPLVQSEGDDLRSLCVQETMRTGRPVYWHLSTSGAFVCSSHIRMMRKAGVPILENSDVLAEYLVYGFVMPPWTMYRDIRELRVGEKLDVTWDEIGRAACHGELFAWPDGRDTNHGLGSAAVAGIRQ